MAIDYTGQEWYDETKTAQENFNAFLKQQKTTDYSLGDFTGSVSGDMEMYTDLKIRASQEKEKVQSFQEAKETEQEKLRTRQNQKIIDFGKECQKAEDAGYDISQIPDGDTF